MSKVSLEATISFSLIIDTLYMIFQKKAMLNVRYVLLFLLQIPIAVRFIDSSQTVQLDNVCTRSKGS